MTPKTYADRAPIASPDPLTAAIKRIVIEAMREVLAEQRPTSTTPDLIHAANLPDGVAKRTFADACRSRELPSSRIGRKVVVRREDFEAWVASHQRPAKPVPANDDGDLEARADAAIDAAMARRKGPRR